VAVQSSTVRIAAGAFADAFGAAKDALRSFGLTLDRIDSRAGVLTTLPTTSAGLATPWSRLDGTFRTAFRRTFRSERLVVRVRFTPTGGVRNDVEDAHRFDAGAILSVEALISPAARPGLRVDPLSPRLASVTRGSEAPARETGGFDAALFAEGIAERDDELAGRITSAVRTSLDGSGG